MRDLRTPKTHNKYVSRIKRGFLSVCCNLCKDKKTIKKWKYWRVLGNPFPWDRIAKVHHMIIPIRHSHEQELTAAEKKEFASIKKKYLVEKYEFIVEASDKLKSIPGHFHLHLIILKDKFIQKK